MGKASNKIEVLHKFNYLHSSLKNKKGQHTFIFKGSKHIHTHKHAITSQLKRSSGQFQEQGQEPNTFMYSLFPLFLPPILLNSKQQFLPACPSHTTCK